ncbi:MAG: hypothetical protein V3U73_00805, partial [bacterium]
TLQNYLGQETMQEAMKEYVKRWRFKHPKSEDFFDVVNDVAGEDLTWYFDQAFRSRKVIDYSISNVFSREVDENEGFDFTLSSGDAGADLSATVTDTSAEFIMESEPMEEDSVISEQDDEEESKMYYSGVNVRRLGEFVFPVEIEVVFDNGDTLRESWDGEDLWKKYRYTRPNKLFSASVDPEHKIVLDVNYTNNSRLVEGRNLGVNKLSGRWLFWMQFLLDQPDCLNLVAVFGDMF